MLRRNHSEFMVEYFDNFNQSFDKLKLNSFSEFNLHLNRFLNEEEENITKLFFESLTSQNKEKEIEKYKKWKIKYKKKQKNEKKKRRIKVLIALGLLPFILYVGNLLYTGEYKFLFQDTSNVKAVIFKTNWSPTIGGYYQNLYFQYEYNEILYENNVKIDKIEGQKNIGDTIFLKISKTYPKRYLIEGYITSFDTQ
ncbi:hypothetical protein SAMN04487765_1376 [Tenacibaculum sp. MAR_2010_89]|uniref:hypothetical protein n=1 Tax=Tenacibaculum sp. MAR_2010_89 TaxID=1250198 RepID=UPI00089A5F9A|nr:hypothetical protein [Tenacibaculum sp. MAR_2010_89]SEE09525.1 hypothetical protein SAMN04487765_1376 [Tenacibaculum sp. MAR_2010_89]